MENQIHIAQIQILKELLFKPIAKFSDLNVTGLTNDHFTFHIKRLAELNLVQKNKNGYELTIRGKEFANRIDTDALKLERQAKTGVLLVCIDQGNYLIQQRLKQPYFGFYGFITGKTRWGETVSETAIRELAEETGLTGIPQLVGIKHKMDYTPEGQLLEDKFFFVVKFKAPKGILIENFEGGKNIWLTKSEIFKLPDLFDGVKESIVMTDSKDLNFSETKYSVKKY